MKFSKWILGAAFLFSAQLATVQGDSACNPCDPCYQSNPCDLCDIDFCDMEFDVYVDALYWQIGKGDLNLGEDDGDEHYLCPEYHWGWRIGGNARWKCWDAGFRYTSFCHEETKGFPFDTEEDAKAKFCFDFDVLDLEVGYTCCVCSPMSFRPFVGAKLAWIEDHFDKEEGDGGSDTKIEFDGYGLYIGSSARWELCSYCMCDRDIPIALVARASTGILNSEFEQKVENGGGDRKCECIYVPVHELYVGLDFTFCDLCGCGDAFFQIGYETQYWGWREYNDDEDITHLGFGGMVLRFGYGF